MAVNPGALAAEIGSGHRPGQPEQRRYAIFTDQHNRKWGGVMEIRSGGFVSTPEPKFSAPVIPPSEFVKPVSDGGFAVEIDYLAWRVDIAKAQREWEDMLRAAAMQLGSQDQVAKLVANPTPEVLYITGPPPKDRPGYVDDIVVQACQAGNRWVLFGEGPMPEKAKPFFADTTPVQARRMAVAPPLEDPFKEPTPSALDHDADEEKPEDKAKRVTPPEEFELTMTSPGRWTLPDGNTVQGTQRDAEHALENLFPEHYLALVEAAGVE